MTDSHTPQRRRALCMLVVANFYWGLSFPVIKALTMIHAGLVPHAHTWFAAIATVAPRFILATAAMAVWHGRSLRAITRREIKQGVIIGAFAGAGMLLQNDGLQFTAASTSAFLTQLYAVLIPIWLAFRRRHNPGGRVWFSCALVLVGVAVLGHFDWRALRFGRGEWETLLSSLFFMGQILWLERPEFAGNDPARLTLVVFATEAILFGALAAATAPDAVALVRPFGSAPWLGLTLILTAFCTIGAFSIMNKWQPKISATEAGLIYCIEPIFGSLMALFLPAWFSAWGGIDYPNEHLSWTLIVGGGLITLANLALQAKPLPAPAVARA